jgi:hypothetical protein
MSDNNYTVFDALVDIVAAPARALDNIRGHTAWFWWPLLITIAVACAAFAYYYSWVDFDWLVDETIAALPPENRAEAADAVRAFMSPTTSIVTTLIVVVLVTLVIYLIQSLYLHIAAKLATSAQIRYGQWFNFSAWTAFPGVFGALAMFVVLFLADTNQVGQHELSPFSMNQLFIHAAPGEPWFNWGNSLNLFHLWMLVLEVFGFRRWTGASLLKSAIIAVLPWVLVFGIWAATI